MSSEKHAGLLNQPCISFSFNSFSYIFQHAIFIAFDQLIEQPQHELDHTCVWSDSCALCGK
ncbi:MAG: hypothetical protein C4586_06975 [Anaerolineaceae bacterium]|nr:MAG: hypothetical protein C4586_06975 [Anaerolineaceae bacterium]